MRVAVTGANGQLGSDVCSAYAEAGHEVIALTHAEVELRDAGAVHDVLGRVRPQLVVNTAAMHNVEACESDPAAAFQVNAIAPRALAQASRAHDFGVVQISTDYVFRGDKGAPYVEFDLAVPLSVYGNSKLSGEHFVQAGAARHFIVRTSGLFGTAPCRAKPAGNFVQVMLRLAREKGEVTVVDDEYVTPTFTADLARQVVRISERGSPGVYHATSQGETSWFDYAAAVFELAGLRPAMHRAAGNAFPAKAPRPKYSVLENAALKAQGIDLMPHWRDSLARYIATLRPATQGP